MDESQSEPTILHEDQYAVIASRRQLYDQMMWHTPVLSLTAQSFLLRTALASGTSVLAREIAAILAFVAAVASVILMQKHRRMEVMCSRWLEEFERKSDFCVVHARPKFTNVDPLWVRLRSHLLWIFTLATFGVAALIIILVAAVAPELLA